MKIGVVDLDTSHPQNWIPIERDLGHEIVGVWDGGSVHPKEYVANFAQDHNIPRVFDSLADLAAEADCAIVHGCDWDTHIEKARPFVEAGKSVLLDKPMAGQHEGHPADREMGDGRGAHQRRFVVALLQRDSGMAGETGRRTGHA